MQDLKVFSDYICPFCFIGKRRAERLAEELPIRPVWMPFEIHPEVPPEGIPLERFMPEMIANLNTRVRELADEIDLDMQMPTMLSNSHFALIGGEFAREAGQLSHYHEAVFGAYFQEGKDIGDIEVLVGIWDKIADDTDSFRGALVNGTYTHALDGSLAEGRLFGLTAVPSFVFADGTVIAGAQPYEMLRAAARKSLRL